MKNLIEAFTHQLEDALRIGNEAKLNQSKKEIRNVVIAGLGGSGIGGNLVESLTSGELKVPVTVIKSYDIPAFVDEHTLFIASSFSGNTEETITVVEQALKRKAKIVAITSGGKILNIAHDNDLDFILIPGESKSPRANIGYSVIQLLFTLYKLNVITDQFIKAFKNTIALLDDQENDIRSEADKIAKQLQGRLPVIYADNKLFPVAVRFQQQINENAKQFAHVNVFPEMNHNELVGWENPREVLENITVIYLKTSYDHNRVMERMNICYSIFNDKANSILEINARGNEFLEQCFYIIHLVDWVSFYLAEQNDVDPFPVEVIDYLKRELANKL